MKMLPSCKQVLIALCALMLGQMACSFGAQSSGSSTQAPTTVSPGATESAPASLPAPSSAPAPSAGRGTPAEAQAMLQHVVEHYLTSDPQQALADFTGKVAPFNVQDLYVVCLDVKKATVSAEGGSPEEVGKPADALKDASGNPLGTAVLQAAASLHGVNGPNNFMKYQGLNPTSGQPEPDVLFFVAFGNDVCYVSAYNP